MSSHEKMFLKKAAQAAQIPEDLSRHVVLLRALGRESILIENYKGILEYSGECLVVQAADCRVRICGKNLWIAYYNEMEMKVCGCIEEIRYC